MAGLTDDLKFTLVCNAVNKTKNKLKSEQYL